MHTRKTSIKDLLTLGEHLVAQIRKDVAMGMNQLQAVRAKPRIVK